jgi:hypothetical protein
VSQEGFRHGEEGQFLPQVILQAVKNRGGEHIKSRCTDNDRSAQQTYGFAQFGEEYEEIAVYFQGHFTISGLHAYGLRQFSTRKKRFSHAKTTI